jgi:hypothetical protein
MEKTIKLTDYVKWNWVSSRQIANRIKNDFWQFYDMWIVINLDFTGIENTTHSFIDELIWIFIFDNSKKATEMLKFSNCNDYIKWIIKFVFADRIKTKKQDKYINNEYKK